MASLKESLKQLKNALKKSDHDTGGNANQGGVISVHTKHSAEALESTKRLLDKDPKNRELLDWYAFMLYSNELFDEACTIYRRLLRQEAGAVEHLYYLGCCCYRLGRIEEAVARWQEAVNADPMSMYGRKAREKIDHVYERDYGASIDT